MKFASVRVGRCNSGHLVWDVVASDGTSDHLHQGRWPIGMSEDRRAQLQEARDLFLRRERA